MALAIASSAQAQNTATLINSGDWNNPAVWTTTPAGNYPNNDNPTLGDVWNVTVGGFTVNVNQNITINDLAWSQGTIGGANTLNLLGSGSIWSGANTKDINSLAAALINTGTISLSGTGVRSLAIGSGLTNASGGVFNITSDGAALVNFNIGTFNNNAGATFEKTAGVGTSSVAWTFNNNGAVSVQSGIVSFTGGGNYGGTTTVSAGATTDFNGGSFTLQDTGSTSGLGTVKVSNSTVNMANGATYTSGAYLTQTGGNLAGSGNATSKLILNGNYDWSAGTLGGNGLININGANNVWSGSGTKDLNAQATSITNAGTINLSGTSLRSLAIGSGLTNASGGVFNITSDGAALVNFNIGTFNNNAGATFEKTAGVGTSSVAWTFNNNGAVSVQSGIVSFTGGGNYGGTTTVSAGATTDFNGGSFTLQDTGSTSGLGTVKVSNSTVNMANGATYTSGAYLTQTAGTLAGSGDATSKLILNGNYDWSAGTLGGNGLININGANNVWSGSGTKDLNVQATSITNAGTINLSGTSLRSLAIGSGLTNASGGVFNITSDGAALVNFNIGTFNNNAGATFEKTAGVGTSSVAWDFANNGLVQATSGVLNFTGAFSQSATGALKVNGATIALPGTPSLQGDLLGAGTIQATTLTHQNGAISPGLSPGTLAFTGNLNLSATTTLNFELGAVSDLITIGGNFTLDGVLNVTAVSGFGAGLYTLFQYAGTLTDHGLTLGSLPSGKTYELINDTANHRIELSVVPEPGTMVLCLMAAAGVCWIKRRR